MFAQKSNKIRIKVVEDDVGAPGRSSFLAPHGPSGSPPASTASLDAELSSAQLDLRLIGFEAPQSSTRRCRLGYAVAAAYSFELALSHNLHRHPHLPVVGSFSRAVWITNRQSEKCSLHQPMAGRPVVAQLAECQPAVRSAYSSSAVSGLALLPELGRLWLHLQQLPYRRAWHVGRELLCDEE